LKCVHHNKLLHVFMANAIPNFFVSAWIGSGEGVLRWVGDGVGIGCSLVTYCRYLCNISIFVQIQIF
jgi:hypothetical protein